MERGTDSTSCDHRSRAPGFDTLSSPIGRPARSGCDSRSRDRDPPSVFRPASLPQSRCASLEPVTPGREGWSSVPLTSASILPPMDHGGKPSVRVGSGPNADSWARRNSSAISLGGCDVASIGQGVGHSLSEPLKRTLYDRVDSGCIRSNVVKMGLHRSAKRFNGNRRKVSDRLNAHVLFKRCDLHAGACDKLRVLSRPQKAELSDRPVMAVCDRGQQTVGRFQLQHQSDNRSRAWHHDADSGSFSFLVSKRPETQSNCFPFGSLNPLRYGIQHRLRLTCDATKF